VNFCAAFSHRISAASSPLRFGAVRVFRRPTVSQLLEFFATSQPIIDGRGRQHASVFVFQNGSVYSSGDTESNAAKV